MAIAKMKRLKMICFASERNEMLDLLQHEGCVEVVQSDADFADPECTMLLRKEVPMVGSGSVEQRLNATKSALEALKKYGGVKGGLFIARKSFDEKKFLSEETLAAAMEHVNQVNALTQRLGAAATKENHLRSQLKTLVPWSGQNLPVELDSTEHATFQYGLFPAQMDFDKITAELAELAPMAELIRISTDKDFHYVMLCAHERELSTALEHCKQYAYSTASFKGLKGTMEENIEQINRDLEAVDAERTEIISGIADMGQHLDEIRYCADRLTQDLAKAEIRQKLVAKGSIVYLEGWMPEYAVEHFEESFSKLTCVWELSDPEEGEMPPVELKNGKLVSSMQMVTEMYAWPAYDGIDPNPLIFPFFSFFYGFMFADMAYGIIMFLAGWLITKKFRPKGGTGNIMKLAMVCGVTTFICGFFTGGFFGDAIPVITETFFGHRVELWSLISPMQKPMEILVFGIILGAIQMIFGMCINIYMHFRDGHGIEGLLDVVPWWITFAGIALVALGKGIWLMLAGFVLLILTQGRNKEGGVFKKLFGGVASLYDLSSWLGDFLSYSRLMALMLATTVVASVVNILGSLAGSILVFIPVFLFGHTFNIGINVIGTYVHAARLQYLEFEGKFYKQGGVQFKPLRYNTKYVDIIDDKGKEVS